MRGFCARDWIRTSTWFPTLRPEHSASTNFATRAKVLSFILKLLIRWITVGAVLTHARYQRVANILETVVLPKGLTTVPE